MNLLADVEEEVETHLWQFTSKYPSLVSISESEMTFDYKYSSDPFSHK